MVSQEQRATANGREMTKTQGLVDTLNVCMTF